ncbi:MAG TPA: hypothetical protein VGH83_02725 [Candidatus Acidoferrum sp.]|jgi:hypothetical protein
MVFGHNSNVTHGQVKYHVQTEDAGIASALIDTTVYCGGRVLHRRTNNYLDLLPLNADREAALKLRVAEQHRQVLEEIRSGTLYLPPVPASVQAAPAALAAGKQTTLQPAKALLVELLNAKSWLAGKRANLHLRISDHSGRPVCDAKIIASVSGAAEPSDFFAESDAAGEAHFAFDMPRLSDPNAALRIEAIHAFGAGHLRFQLRARQRVPVVQG